MWYRIVDEKVFMRLLPSQNHHEFGYEERYDFERRVCTIFSQWKGKKGEVIDSRPGLRKLRFHNKYGSHEDAWVPFFMLSQAAEEEEKKSKRRNVLTEEEEKLMDEIFGFDD